MKKLKFNDNSRLQGIFAGIVLLFYAGFGWSAPPIPDAADIPRPQPISPPAPRPAEINPSEKPVEQPLTDDSSRMIQVEKFVFKGNQAFSANALSALLVDYVGRENGMDALNRAAKTITDYYRQHGYLLALAYLPAQEIRQNVVEIAVLEGQLSTLKLNGPQTLNHAFLNGMASYHLPLGVAITEQTLVRNVTVLNTLPAMRASAQLNPGEAIGSSAVEIELQPLPKVEGFIAANTYGNRFTGRETLQAGLSVNNLAGVGDQLFVGIRNSRDDGQRGFNLGYLLPIHASGTLLSLSYYYVDYKLGGPFKQLDASGDSQFFNVDIEQPLMRNAQGGISARISGAYKQVDDKISAFSLNNQRDITNLDIGLVSDWFNREGDVSYRVGAHMRGGQLSFKNAFAESLDATSSKTEGHFLKYNLTANRVQYFSNNLSFALRADYQYANKNLDSVEKIVIGGINRWRAFAELPSQADTGFMAGLELRKNIFAGPKLAGILLDAISPYGFVDVGHGRVNRNALSSDNHVKSLVYGVGADLAFRQKWGLSLVASHQVRKFDGLSQENETRVWGQLQKNF